MVPSELSWIASLAFLDVQLSVASKNSLEVVDKQHRYCKHLRAYYSEWTAQGRPSGDFWSWIDGEDKVNLELCPRSTLEGDTVHYCCGIERKKYIIAFGKCGELLDCNGDAVQTGPEGWIFVIGSDGIFYANQKLTRSPRFHHTSFLAGAPCLAAGRLHTASDGSGEIVQVDNHSGHYRPQEHQLKGLLLFLRSNRVNLSGVQVDMQRVVKVARDKNTHKHEAPHLWRGQLALDFLQCKSKAASTLFKLVQAQKKELRDIETAACKQSHTISEQSTRLHPRPIHRLSIENTVIEGCQVHKHKRCNHQRGYAKQRESRLTSNAHAQ
jgi:hypothetical protein